MHMKEVCECGHFDEASDSDFKPFHTQHTLGVSLFWLLRPRRAAWVFPDSAHPP